MKTYIIVAIVVLCMSTLLSGYADTPGTKQVGIGDVAFGSQTTQETDGLHGNFLFVDGYRPYKGADMVVDKPG